MIRRTYRGGSRWLALVMALVAAVATTQVPGSPVVAQTGPPVLFSDGFESGSLSGWTSGSGLVVQQGLVADGLWAAQGVMNGAAASVSRTLAAPVSEATVRLRVNLSSIGGTSALNFVKVRNGSGVALAELYVTPGRVLGLRNDVTGVATNSPVSVSTGVWHDVSFRVRVGGVSSSVEVSFDGAVVPSLSVTTDLGLAGIGRVQVGENVTGRVATVTYDTVTVTGAVPSADPVLAAAGDIACDPLNSNFNGGAGTTNNCRMAAVASLLADPSIKAIAPLGDVQYECGGLAAFQASYHPTWGQYLDITHPAVGNHEYIASSATTPATGCDPTGMAAGYYSYFGPGAGDPAKGYYSYELGAWHVVVLNTTCAQAGGCGAGSPQETWLRADLAAHPTMCTLAYFHIPLWSSGGRAAQNAKAFTTALYQAGAEVMLTGHDHIYERFAPQDANGVAAPLGIQAFVVGTGGANHTTIPTVAPNSEVRDTTAFGVLLLTLHAGSYDWRFVPEAGRTFTDSGTATCH